MQDFVLSPLEESDRIAVIDLFNYYVEHSDAAYPETRVTYEFFDLMMQMARGYPTVAVRIGEGSLAGFGILRPYNPFPVFAHTAEITFFIRPEDTGKGLGTRMLHHLENECRKKGISVILASVSSRNEGSIRFHEKNGFSECGRFRNVGKKRGNFFDMVWMEKQI